MDNKDAAPLVTLKSQPGVRRDGTSLDSPYYSHTVWARFQRGKPRKMGGYVQLSGQLNGPVRSVLVQPYNGITPAHYFSQWGVQRQLLSPGSATGLIDRTPVGFAANPLLNWSQTVLYSATGGAYKALIAASAPDVLDLSSDVGGGVYTGDLGAETPLTVVSDGSGALSVSGGVTALQPFLVLYGSNGLIRNSNTNDYSAATGWTTGGANKANSANVAGTKIVYGAPTRGGGQSPAGLFWALDAVVRMSFVGGDTLWSYDTLSSPASILSKRCVVEHDGKFFWIGADRFLFYNGIVQELPNQMNLNDFFDNLNPNQRNKVWGLKVGRFGEIWWFYPRGSDVECGHAIIFNYVENTWYDAVKQRSAGHAVTLYPNPVWAGNEDFTDTTALPIGLALANSVATAGGSAVLTFVSTTGVANGQVITGHANLPANATVSAFTATTVTMSGVALATGIPIGTALTFSSMTTGFLQGQTVTGGTSGATGVVRRVSALVLNLTNVAGTFTVAEALTSTAGVARLLSATYTQQLGSVYAHERGWDKVAGQDVSALVASFTTCDFGFAAGGPFDKTPTNVDIMSRLVRLEPDLGQVGPVTVGVSGKSYANQEYKDLYLGTVEESDSFINPDVQERFLRVTVASNVQGGFFELGQTLLDLRPGDASGSR